MHVQHRDTTSSLCERRRECMDPDERELKAPARWAPGIGACDASSPSSDALRDPGGSASDREAAEKSQPTFRAVADRETTAASRKLLPLGRSQAHRIALGYDWLPYESLAREPGSVPAEGNLCSGAVGRKEKRVADVADAAASNSVQKEVTRTVESPKRIQESLEGREVGLDHRGEGEEGIEGAMRPALCDNASCERYFEGQLHLPGGLLLRRARQSAHEADSPALISQKKKKEKLTDKTSPTGAVYQAATLSMRGRMRCGCVRKNRPPIGCSPAFRSIPANRSVRSHGPGESMMA